MRCATLRRTNLKFIGRNCRRRTLLFARKNWLDKSIRKRPTIRSVESLILREKPVVFGGVTERGFTWNRFGDFSSAFHFRADFDEQRNVFAEFRQPDKQRKSQLDE